jgi:pescadillo protein
LVRERYPRFVDALSDLDDALTLVHLFAALPSEVQIKAKVTNKAKSLAAAWGAYCATTSSMTKSFISVKGVYMESEVRGSTLRWVIPHSFTQNLPTDVDYRVMLTFFEFYDTLLSFVLFKLYNELGVRYPFPLSLVGGEVKGSTSSILAANLRALTNAFDSNSGAVSNVISETIEKASDEVEKESKTASKESKKKSQALIKSVGAALNNLQDDSDDDDDDDGDADVAGPLKAALESMAQDEERGSTRDGPVLDEDATKRRRLFAGLTFFLSREVPRGYLELVCLSYGGRVGWEGPYSPITASDPSITHHVVDRPKLPSSYDSLPKSREFVQPQWVLDCANFLFLLPVAKYGVGATLPPHLSPWVDDEEEGYKPAYAQEVERLMNGESLDEDVVQQVDTAAASSDDEKVDSPATDASESEEEEEDEGVSKEREAQLQTKEVSSNENVVNVDFGFTLIIKKPYHLFLLQEKETHDLAKVMMSKKANRLYGRMQHGLSQKQAKVDLLHKRREELDRSKRNDAEGKTPLKQKVERLKKERKAVEDEYSNTVGTMKKRKTKKSR